MASQIFIVPSRSGTLIATQQKRTTLSNEITEEGIVEEENVEDIVAGEGRQGI